jgi:hypothetical protein
MTQDEGTDRVPVEAADAGAPATHAEAPAGREEFAGDRAAQDLAGGRAAQGLVTVAGIVLIAVLSTGTMFLTGSSVLLGPIAGLAAGLGMRRLLDAGIASGLGAIAGTAGAWAVSLARWPSPVVWAVPMLRDALIAAVLALAVRWMLDRSPRFAALMAAAAVTLVIVSGWMSSTSLETLQLKPGMTRVQYFAIQPKIDYNAADEDLYLSYVMDVAKGQRYYPSAVAVLSASNVAHPLGPVQLSNPLSYRLPTLYWTLGQLPVDGVSLIMAMMLMGSAAAVAGYVLARQFVTVPLALASCAGLTAMYAMYSTVPGMLHSEIWAGSFSLIAVTLFVLARRKPAHAMAYMAAAAAAAMLAALIRELAVAVVLLGLALTLMDREARRQRLWVPWAVAIGGTVAGFAAHWAAATAAFRAVTLPKSRPVQVIGWFRPDGLGLYAGIDFFRRIMVWPLAAGCVAGALGLAGAVFGPKERLQRLAMATLVGGGMLVVCFFRPNGITSLGVPVGYWSEIYIPTMVACIPLALAWMPGARRVED